MRNKGRRIFAYICVAVLLLTTVMGPAAVRQVEAAEESAATPVYLDGFQNVTVKSFADANGNPAEAKEYGYTDNPDECEWNDFTLKNLQGNDVTSMHRQLLSMKVKLTSGDYTELIQVMGNQTWNGFGIYSSTDGETLNFLDVYNVMTGRYEQLIFSKDTADVTSFLNEEFILQISFEYGDYDEGGTANDVRLGFYFNGVLYNNEHNTIYDCNTEQFGTYLTLMRYPGASITVDNVMPVNEELHKITWSDFAQEDMSAIAHRFTSTEDEVFGYQLTKEGVDNMAPTSFQAKLTFGTSGSDNRIYFAGINDWEGMFLFAEEDGTLQLYDALGPDLGFGDGRLFVFDPSVAGVTTFLNQEFTCRITTEFADYDGDGDSNDVQMGFYFNDKLYAGQYLYAFDCKESFGNWLSIHPQNGSVTIRSIIENPEVLNPDLDRITFRDFDIADYTYLYNPEGDLSTYGVYEGESLSGVVFSGYVTFSASTEAYINLGGKNSAWEGLNLCSTDEGNLWLLNYTGCGGFEDIELNSVIAGTDLTENRFYLQVSIEYVALDNDEKYNDVKLGVWFNEVLYGNSYFYLNGCADYLGKHLGIYCETADDFIQVVSDRCELPEDVDFYNLADGAYLLIGEDSIMVNGTEAEEDTLTVAGDYQITSSDGLYEKRVALYLPEDAHPDGVIDARDLIAALKVQNGVPLTTWSGGMGADVDGDGAVEQEDIHHIRETLLSLPKSEYWKNTAVFFEPNVMPIGGSIAPYADVDEKTDVYYNYFTEPIYQAIVNAGINMIGTTAHNYQYSPTNIILALENAEKYGLDMYILDHAISTADEGNIAELMQTYGQYRSFKGIVVGDEPSTSYYGKKSDLDINKTMEAFGGPAKLLNGYSNLHGELCLYPMKAFLDLDANDEKGYADYVEDFIQQTQPRMIPYDNYVFDDDAFENYFENMSIIRQKALEHNLPFWTCIQAGSNWNDAAIQMKPTTNDSPTEEEMLWNVNTSLAYGAKGLHYFPIIQPFHFAYTEGDTYDYDRNGLIGADGLVNEIWYYGAQKANAQVSLVDEVLMNARSKDVLAVGTAAQSATQINDNHFEETVLSSIEVGDTEVGVITGIFDYQGKEAYYVVNYSTTTSQTVTLNYDSEKSYSVLGTIDNLTDTATSGSAQSCALNLKAGGAALVLLDK